MITPVNEHSVLAAPAPRYKVLLSGSSVEIPPDYYSENPDSVTTSGNSREIYHLRPRRLVRSSGSGKLDYVEFDIDLETEGRLADKRTPEGFDKQVELRVTPSLSISGASLPLIKTAICQQTAMLHGSIEESSLVARIEPWMFGRRLTFYRVATSDGETVDIEGPIVFQPEIDDEVLDNCSEQFTDSERGFFHWIDPESVRSVSAQEQQNNTAIAWTLSRAIYTVCWLANPDEEFVKNPTLSQFSGKLLGAPVPDNFKLPRGRYLNELLDLLLEPFGYSWYLAAEVGEDGLTYMQIKIYKRNEGSEKVVYLQKPVSDIDPLKTNLASASIDWNIAECANVVIVEGSRKEIEGTWELYRTWPEADDVLSSDELRKSDPTSLYVDHKETWRKWALNEAGDYNEVRPGTPIVDFGSENLIKRRKFEHCVARNDDGSRRRVVLEMYNPATDTWVEAPFSFSLLDAECGVILEGDTPPADLIVNGEDARLRITASVKLDQRISQRAERQASSPNANEIELWLDMADRFFWREILVDGDNASIYSDSAGDDNVDDTIKAQEFAESVRGVEESARISCSLVVQGIDLSYEIGDLITEINGRSIELDMAAPSNNERRYLQISEITYDFYQSTTTLRVRTWDDVKPKNLRFI